MVFDIGSTKGDCVRLCVLATGFTDSLIYKEDVGEK